MGQNSEHRLPALSADMKSHIIDARATGQSFDEIAQHFRDYFPNYANHIPDDMFVNIFSHRLKKFVNASSSSAKLYIEAKERGEIPTGIEAIPLVMPHVRLLSYQRLWDETPVKSIQRTVLTEDGEEIVYKYHTKERLAILTELRRELESLGLIQQKKKSTDDFDDDDLVELVEGSDLWETAEDAD